MPTNAKSHSALVLVVLDTGDRQPIIAAYVSTKARLEAFSDGIFAIAATLLVLDLAIPKPEPTLLSGFLQSWPSYAAYATSFVTIGIIWVNHHTVLERMDRIDRGLLFLNLILMLFVALIPFPTKVLAHYLQSGGANAHTAAAAYGVAMMLMGISFSLINVYAVARGLFPDHQRLTLWQQIRFSIGLVMYAAGTGLSLVDARIGLLIYAALAVYYVAEPLLERTRPVAVHRTDV